MLKKLLKYDIKYLFQHVFVYFIVMVCLALLTRVVNLLPSNKLCHIVISGCNVLFVLASIGFPIFGFVYSIKRYNKNILSDEGYLTHTLPVKESSILLAKLISNLILTLCVGIWLVISLLIAYADKNTFRNIADFFIEIFNYEYSISNGWVATITIEIIITGVFYLLLATTLVPMCQTIGSLFENKRGLMTLISIIASIVCVELIITIYQYIALPSLHSLSIKGLSMSLIGQMFVLCGIIIVFYLTTLTILKKRLQLK